MQQLARQLLRRPDLPAAHPLPIAARDAPDARVGPLALREEDPQVRLDALALALAHLEHRIGGGAAEILEERRRLARGYQEPVAHPMPRIVFDPQLRPVLVELQRGVHALSLAQRSCATSRVRRAAAGSAAAAAGGAHLLLVEGPLLRRDGVVVGVAQRVILLTVVVVRRAAGGGAGAASGATTAGGVNRGPARGWRLARSVVCSILPRALLHGRGAGARSR